MFVLRFGAAIGQVADVAVALGIDPPIKTRILAFECRSIAIDSCADVREWTMATRVISADSWNWSKQEIDARGCGPVDRHPSTIRAVISCLDQIRMNPAGELPSYPIGPTHDIGAAIRFVRDIQKAKIVVLMWVDPQGLRRRRLLADRGPNRSTTSSATSPSPKALRQRRSSFQ